MAIARRLALGRLVSLAGGSAAYIALTAAVYQRTGSPLWISAAIFSGTVTSVLAAPAAGWVGDRFDRRSVLVASDVVATAVSLAMAATAHHAAALVVLLGASALAQAPFEPASAAALPSVVGERDVARANALVAATASAAYLVGPLIGGVALGFGASPATVFVVDAATFAVSAALVATIRLPFGRGSTRTHPGVLAGVRALAGDRALRTPVAASTVSLLGIGVVGVAAYPLSIRLGGGAGGYGALTALLGGGGLVGSALAARVLGTRPARVLPAAFAAAAAGLALAGAAPWLAAALVGVAVAGAARGLADVAVVTTIQQRAADEIRSRVFAADDGAAHVAYSVSALGGGLLVAATGVRATFLIAAGFGLAAAGIVGRDRN